MANGSPIKLIKSPDTIEDEHEEFENESKDEDMNKHQKIELNLHTGNLVSPNSNDLSDKNNGLEARNILANHN